MREKTNNFLLLEELLNIHTELKLCGKLSNVLLNVSDNLLLYVLSLLRDEEPLLPDNSIAEWNELISILKLHWIVPFLYFKIGHIPHVLRPPKEIIMQMKYAFLWSLTRSYRIEKQLREILEAFNTDFHRY